MSARLLETAQASQLLQRLAPKLRVQDSAELGHIVSLLDTTSHSTTVAAVMQRCYRAKTGAAALKAFERLYKRLGDAAISMGLNFALVVQDHKTLGGQRSVHFAGQILPTAHAELRDLDGARRSVGGEPIEQSGILLSDQGTAPIVVAITVSPNEMAAVRAMFLPDGRPPVSVEKRELVFDDFGLVGNYRLLHIACEMGSIGAQARVAKVVEIGGLKLVVGLGMAFGVLDDQSKPDVQKMGDVLIASCVQGYELQRVNKGGSAQLRELAVPAPDHWLQRVKRLQNTLVEGRCVGPRMHIGKVLSGQKLVDDKWFRDELVRLCGGDAIGGEMEGIGLAAACAAAPVHWLLIKGIADWADGDKPKGGEKVRVQADASRNAAWVLRALLDHEFAGGEGKTKASKSSARKMSEQERIGRADLQDLNAIGRVIDSHGRSISLSQQLSALKEADANSDDAAGSAFEKLVAWAQSLTAPRYFAVLSEYGLGKTVLLQRLTQDLTERRVAGEAVLRPVYLDLRRITGLQEEVLESGKVIRRDRVPSLEETLDECIKRGWRDEPGVRKPSAQDVLAWVAAGALVIFDGLDEVLVHLTEANGQQFTNQLLRILPAATAGENNLSKLLISCRTHLFKSLREQRSMLLERSRGDLESQHFDALLLLPFSDAQIEQYLKSALPSLDVDAAIATIRAVHNLSELASRPYLLKNIAALVPMLESWRAEGRCVQGVTVYREMARDWLQRDKGKHQIDAEHKLALARDLAAELWRRGQRLIDADALSSWYLAWRSAQTDPKRRYEGVHIDKLDEDLRNSQFLVRQDNASEAESGFRFAHSSLLEFFLAEYLLQAIRDSARVRWVMPVPSRETLDFFGQLLEENAQDLPLMQTLNTWRTPYLAQASEVYFHYAIFADQKGWRVPSLQGVDLHGAKLRGLQVGRKRESGEPKLGIEQSNFSGADLRDTAFRYCRLNGADFTRARLIKAEFHDSNLRAIHVDTADLTGTVFRRCDLTGTGFDKAHTYRTKFAHGTVAAPKLEGALAIPDVSAKKALHSRIERLRGHTYSGRAAAFAPSGQSIVSAGWDNILCMWDAATGECLRELAGHSNAISSCAFAPDGLSIVSASDDKTLRIWNAATGECVLVLAGHIDSVSSCAFALDSQVVVSASYDNTLRIWNAVTGTCVRILRGHERFVSSSCIFAPDGLSILSGSSDNNLRLWNAATGECLRVFAGHSNAVSSCAFAPNGLSIVSASDDKTLRIWNAATGECLRVLEGHGRSVSSCAFAPDGLSILSASHDKTLRLWNAATGECLHIVVGHQSAALSCAFSPDGLSIVSTNENESPRVWNAATGECVHVLAGYIDPLWCCSFAPDGLSIVSASYDNNLRLWNAATGECLRVLEGHESSVWSCAFAPDGLTIVSASHDHTLRHWNAATGECMRVLAGHQNAVASCAFAPNGQSIVSASWDKTLRIWDTATGECLRVLAGHRGWVRCCAFASDGRSIVSAGDDLTIRLWDAASGECLRVLVGHQDWVRGCAFAPDGRTIASVSDDHTLRLWNTASGECLRVMAHDLVAFSSCAFAPDGDSIISTSYGKGMHLWNAATGECLRVLSNHPAGVESCAFSPDGQSIVSASEDNTLRLWDTATGECQMVICADETGTAAWRPQPIGADGKDEPKRLLHATGEMWRHLAWLVPDENGALQRLPLETFGDMCLDA